MVIKNTFWKDRIAQCRARLGIAWSLSAETLQCLGLVVLFTVFGGGGETVIGADLYRETWRPQYHFTPERNWMNDPNGMVFFEGEYHLFYQYNPMGDRWGHMSWGHAVSRDLIHWEHLPLALAEEDGVMIFSGSAVVDWENTSNFGIDGKPPLVAIYTGHRPSDGRQTQCLAFSNDRGRSWWKYGGNPVIDIESNDFRDPKVFWYAPTRQWIMVVSLSVERKVRFYASANLKDWRHLSDFGPAGSTTGIWECPDLFPLEKEGTKDSQGWVLIVNVGSGAPAGGSGCQYFVGEFDGQTFVMDEASRPAGEAEFLPPGQLLADFEGDDYGDWETEGEAFGQRPARHIDRPFVMASPARGTGVANSFGGDDEAQGVLRSPTFLLQHDTLNFLIAGGHHPGETCMNLLVDDQVVRTVTGDNSGDLQWRFWDLSDLQGKEARLAVVDKHTGGWGHIQVDHIFLADEPVRPAVEPALWADYGPDFYAAVSWSDVPARDGRRLWLAWMSNWRYAQDVPTSPWRSAMTLPRSLSLHDTPDGWRLAQIPAKETRRLRQRRHRLRTASLEEANQWLERRGPFPSSFEMIIEWAQVGATSEFGLRLQTAPRESSTITFDAAAGTVSVNRAASGRSDFYHGFGQSIQAPWRLEDGRARLRLFGDSSSLEVFTQDGQVSVTSLVFPESQNYRFEVWPEDGQGDLRIQKMELWELDSIWER